MTQITPAMKTELIAFLKKNLSLVVSEKTTTVDRSYGEYCEKTDFIITLSICDEVISEESIYTYGS